MLWAELDFLDIWLLILELVVAIMDNLHFPEIISALNCWSAIFCWNISSLNGSFTFLLDNILIVLPHFMAIENLLDNIFILLELFPNLLDDFSIILEHFRNILEHFIFP